jgi:hypothetical protein
MVMDHLKSYWYSFAHHFLHAILETQSLNPLQDSRTYPYAKPVIYADDTSVLITANNLNDLQTKFNSTLNYMNEWSSVNGLSLIIDEIKIVKFSSNYLSK